MAFYKEPCIHCGNYISKDSAVCPICNSTNPFKFSCPECLREISPEEQRCSCCGRELKIKCPYCNELTFVYSNCEQCGKSLMKQCSNKRCNSMQFYDNKKCNACGKNL